MKSLLSILLFPLLLTPTQAQKAPVTQDAISAYFTEYANSGNFDVVYISGRVFQLIDDADLNLEGMEEKEVAAILNMVEDVQGIRLLHTDENPAQYFADAKKRIPTKDYDLLFEVRTRDGDRVEAFMKGQGSALSELLLMVGGENTFALVSFVGLVDLSKLGELQAAME